MNNVSFEDPTVPILLQILSGTTNAQDLIPAGSIYGLTRGQVVEVTIPAGPGAVAGPVGPLPIISSESYMRRLDSIPSTFMAILSTSSAVRGIVRITGTTL